MTHKAVLRFFILSLIVALVPSCSKKNHRDLHFVQGPFNTQSNQNRLNSTCYVIGIGGSTPHEAKYSFIYYGDLKSWDIFNDKMTLNGVQHSLRDLQVDEIYVISENKIAKKLFMDKQKLIDQVKNYEIAKILSIPDPGE